ncbi:hypothetical protein V1525DRAFT_396012 [Lipomyces kononenkoae]|uniref:Uncharacterized protein n=1 Tax=Lipomyces kononenkoae TaxID=34357 RepID=A0ACC3T835_LIPKO
MRDNVRVPIDRDRRVESILDQSAPVDLTSARGTTMATAPDGSVIPTELLVGKDAVNAMLPDSAFERFSWERLKDIIRENKLELLTRVPSDLRKYLIWKTQIIKQHGSVANFVLFERLNWGPDPALAKPISKELFEVRDDYKMLMNDFPYGFDDGIIHVVVWTKNPIPIAQTGSPTADITPEVRQKLTTFVDTIRESLGMKTDDILWFKNWAALQSVSEIDHFHILLNKPPVDDSGVERLLSILADDYDVQKKWAAVDSRLR